MLRAPLLEDPGDVVPSPQLTVRAADEICALTYPIDNGEVRLLGARSSHEYANMSVQEVRGQQGAALPTIAMFMGYASLFGFQHVLKQRFGIPDDSSDASHWFSYCIACLYLGVICMRVFHGVLFAYFQCRPRCLVGMLFMLASMSTIGVVILGLEQFDLRILAAAYLVGGFGVGVFETNYSVVLCTCGEPTKLWGVWGIPVGIFMMIVPGFLLVTFGVPLEFMYGCVFCCVCAACFALQGLKTTNTYVRNLRRVSSTKDVKAVESTELLYVLSLGAVFMVNMTIVSAFSPGVLLYIFNRSTVEVPRWTPSWDAFVPSSIPTGVFFALFSSFGFVADSLSRRMAYKRSALAHPAAFLVFSLLGICVLSILEPMTAPVGTLLVFFANGSIYATSSRLIDRRFATGSHALVATSAFFFMGDLGSVAGSMSVPMLRDWLTSDAYVDLRVRLLSMLQSNIVR